MLFSASPYFQNGSFTNTGPYAIFYVMKFNATGATSGDWQTLTDNISPLRPFVGYDANSQTRVSMAYGGSATTNPEIWSLQYSASTTTGFFVNGSSTIGASTGYGGVGHTNGMRVGFAGNSTAPLNGWLGEILFFGGTLTTLQRQQMEGYLAWKWGLQTNLPSNHPFRGSPPFSAAYSFPPRSLARSSS